RVRAEVEDRHDRGMAQPGAGAALPQEACAPDGRIGSARPEDLDGDLVAERRAPREVDVAHAAATEPAANLVLAVEDDAVGEHGPIVAAHTRGARPPTDEVARETAGTFTA